jgi:hypothetical protein
VADTSISVASEVENVSSVCAFNVNVKKEEKYFSSLFYTRSYTNPPDRGRERTSRSAMVSIAACTMINIANVNG